MYSKTSLRGGSPFTLAKEPGTIVLGLSLTTVEKDPRLSDEARYSLWKVGVAGSHCVCRPVEGGGGWWGYRAHRFDEK
jgi:hypothetical protein